MITLPVSERWISTHACAGLARQAHRHVGTHPRDQIRRNIIPAFVELEETREGGERVRQGVPARVQSQMSQLPEAALGNEDLGKRGVADIRLQLEDCHFLDGIL